MNANEQTIRDLYDALARKDGDGMAACYATDATFSDPIFPDLKGPEVGGMWRMLCAGATDLKVQLDYVNADVDAGSARWVATYTFSRTGRHVRNVGEANFELKGGLILAHVDSFPFWRWSRQALGTPGLVLGWTPFLRRKVCKDVAGRLQRYMQEHPAPNPKANGKKAAGTTPKKAKSPASRKS